MIALRATAFALPAHLTAKADPELIAADEEHFAALRHCLDATIAELTERLDAERRASARSGQAAMDRDLQVHRLTARLRTLRRFGLDLCLGRMITSDADEAVYVGRLGLTEAGGRRLLVDWRSPAAEPFFAATHADPMGLASRRRYRWSAGRVSDYWDEVFTSDGIRGHAALDDHSAFIASLGSSRSARMRDVLGTIQADQDAVIRAAAPGVLVVDGGPGTGKTVAALHRCAYLLYAEPRLDHRHGGVLFVGPHQPFLDYVSDVLPSLGEDGVRTCTLRDLVAEGAGAVDETDPEVARLKQSAQLVTAVEAAVRIYEQPPAAGLRVETDWADVWLTPADWAEAFDAPDPGTPHNEAREQVWERLVEILVDKHDSDVAPHLVRTALLRNADLRSAFNRAWPVLDAADVVADLWSVPAYLRACAPSLSAEDVRALQRRDPYAWTTEDLPLLDAARHHLGDPKAARRQRERDAALDARRVEMDRVVEDLIAADDSEMLVMSMLRGADLQDALADTDALPHADPDRLAGPFAHIVVDEAQELTDAQWQMLLRRCPSRSFTVVGDRAQARHGFAESWQQRLERVGLGPIRLATLRVNYRTPVEVMAEAEPVIRAVLPDANVPTSVRATGIAVRHAAKGDLRRVVERWLATNPDGIACVIGDPTFAARARVRSLSPALAKGLEFDLVVLVDPIDPIDPDGPDPATSVEAAVDRYVAMTRATRELVILSGP